MVARPPFLLTSIDIFLAVTNLSKIKHKIKQNSYRLLLCLRVENEDSVCSVNSWVLVSDPTTTS